MTIERSNSTWANKKYHFARVILNNVKKIVLEYAAGGLIVKWDQEKRKFHLNVPADTPEGVLSEAYLRKIFRDCIKAISYCKFLKNRKNSQNMNF